MSDNISLNDGKSMNHTSTSATLLNRVLDDIAENLSFDERFSIVHPAYRTWSRDDSTMRRMEQLTPKTRHNHLRKHLQSYLYGVYYNQSLQSKLTLEANTVDNPVLHQDDLTIGMVQAELFQALHTSNTGEGYWDSGWMVEKHESDGAVAVLKNDCRLHVSPKQHLKVDALPPLGSPVAIRMPKNHFQGGFYVATSNIGLPEPSEMTEAETLVRIYFNISAQISPNLMGFLTHRLNEVNACFNYKSPSHPDNYSRSDAGVLYFLKQDYQRVQPIIEQVYLTFGQDLSKPIPLFTKHIAPGIGLAEEPWQKIDPPYESFGMNRCAMIAIALLRLPKLNAMTPAAKKEAILSVFEEFSIDPLYPYLNPGSLDIFEPLSSEQPETSCLPIDLINAEATTACPAA